MEEDNQNHDLLQLSNAGVQTHVSVNYDIRTLIKSEQVYDVDPELINQTVTDEEYLESYRRRAEAKLIKSKIIYKINTGAGMSGNEKTYLK